MSAAPTPVVVSARWLWLVKAWHTMSLDAINIKNEVLRHSGQGGHVMA